MRKNKQQKEKYEGVWSKTGKSVIFSRVWGGHRFTDEECRKLLAGEMIAFSGISSSGKKFDVYGTLGQGGSNENNYIGFQKIGFGKKDAGGKPLPPQQWCGHTFTSAEIQTLADGGTVEADFVSKRGRRKYTTTVRFGRSKDGQYRIIPRFSEDF